MKALRRKNWTPDEHSRICSAHFVGGKKSDDKLSPAYVPTLFVFVQSPVKRRYEAALETYGRHAKRLRFPREKVGEDDRVLAGDTVQPESDPVRPQVAGDKSLLPTGAADQTDQIAEPVAGPSTEPDANLRSPTDQHVDRELVNK